MPETIEERTIQIVITKDPLYLAIEEHWREHRPKMVQALEANGRLSRAIETAASRTAEAESQAIRRGLSVSEAQELFQTQWAFLPSEDEAPTDTPSTSD